MAAFLYNLSVSLSLLAVRHNVFCCLICTVNKLYLAYKHALLNYNTDIASVMFAKPVAVRVCLVGEKVWVLVW